MGVNGSPVSVHPHIVTERSTVHPHIVTEPKDVVGVRVFPERPAAVGSRLVYSGGVGVDLCWPGAVPGRDVAWCCTLGWRPGPQTPSYRESGDQGGTPDRCR